MYIVLFKDTLYSTGCLKKGALIEMAITPLKSLRNNGKGWGVLENCA